MNKHVCLAICSVILMLSAAVWRVSAQDADLGNLVMLTKLETGAACKDGTFLYTFPATYEGKAITAYVVLSPGSVPFANLKYKKSPLIGPLPLTIYNKADGGDQPTTVVYSYCWHAPSGETVPHDVIASGASLGSALISCMDAVNAAQTAGWCQVPCW